MRLIDADKLKRDPYIRKGGHLINLAIDEAKTVDAVKVVRCRDCKWFVKDSGVCDFWFAARHPDHYCGEGEKRKHG